MVMMIDGRDPPDLSRMLQHHLGVPLKRRTAYQKPSGLALELSAPERHLIGGSPL